MSARSAHLPLAILTSRSPCCCFFTNASTTRTAATAVATVMTESIRKHSISRRSFMSTPRQHNASGRSIMDETIKRKARSAPSVKIDMKKEAASRDMPNDVGLLPETFIMPSGKNLPSLLNDPKKRWRLEWKRVKNELKNFVMLIIYKFADSLRPRPALELRQRKKIARELYELMNQAIAEKDIATLRSICTDGIFDSLQTRISWRDRDEHLYWSLASPPSSLSSRIINRLLDRQNIKASVVSDRSAPLPAPFSPPTGPRNRLRQIVVRLESAQKLVRWRWKDDNEEAVAKSATSSLNSTQDNDTSRSTSISTEDDIKREILAQIFNPKDPHQQQQQQQQHEQGLLNKIDILSATGFPHPHQSTEYLVLQQILMNGIQQPWTIWGNAEETSIETLEQWERGYVDYAKCAKDDEKGEGEIKEGSRMRVGVSDDSGTKVGV